MIVDILIGVLFVVLLVLAIPTLIVLAAAAMAPFDRGGVIHPRSSTWLHSYGTRGTTGSAVAELFRCSPRIRQVRVRRLHSHLEIDVVTGFRPLGRAARRKLLERCVLVAERAAPGGIRTVVAICRW